MGTNASSREMASVLHYIAYAYYQMNSMQMCKKTLMRVRARVSGGERVDEWERD